MLQIVGLIVSVYACTRLASLPLAATANREDVLGWSFKTRFIVLAVVSLVGAVLVAVLGVVLLFWSPGPAPSFRF